MTSLNLLSLERTLTRVFDKRSNFARLVQHPDFWPIALKGGCENTIRDIILADINRNLPSQYVCSGERTHRDIAIYERKSLNKTALRTKSNPIPTAVVELKFNFISQRSQWDRGIDAYYSLSRESIMHFAVIHLLCDIYRADDISKALLRRYVSSRQIDRTASENATKGKSFDDFENHCTEKLCSYAVRRLNVSTISDGENNNHGEIVTFLMHPISGEKIK